ncbi:leucine-rich repeat domain-containing protein [Candidatus Comchoanobacter bicostacola]|uniref:Leucine-rich repeat domain-containing protein n=1 Tax=Candidatus Comchoanobacter bicostacola TaxID=2919598 RepID=A0ABY5DJY5_9GAMM|nr:leucine-rich repeat domain-containing protein [Candidatus Comchoanobacter bicostacola]UTC24599.1 leucine-rich repeat domain-containing protein [Candidatus Comchoanobacter bicostacola]
MRQESPQLNTLVLQRSAYLEDASFSDLEGFDYLQSQSRVRIGHGTFEASSFRSVTIGPRSFVGQKAFAGLQNLSLLTLNANVGLSTEAFHGCSRLRMLVLKGAIGRIAISAFSGCDNLRLVALSYECFTWLRASSVNVRRLIRLRIMLPRCRFVLVPPRPSRCIDLKAFRRFGGQGAIGLKVVQGQSSRPLASLSI